MKRREAAEVLLAAGFSRKAVQHLLGISERTASRYARSRRPVGLTRGAEHAAAYLIRNQILPPDRAVKLLGADPDRTLGLVLFGTQTKEIWRSFDALLDHTKGLRLGRLKIRKAEGGE